MKFKCRIRETTKKKVFMPEVGEIFQCRGSNEVFIRIRDNDGVNLLSQCYRSIDNDDIIIYVMELKTVKIMSLTVGIHDFILLRPKEVEVEDNCIVFEKE